MFSQGYLIDTQLCIAALWLFYIAVLHRRTDLRAARIFLLSFVPVGMSLPLLRIPLLPTEPFTAHTIPQDDVTAPIDVALPEPDMSLSEILTWIYAAGAALALAFTLSGILRAWLRVRKNRESRIVFSSEVAGAYSVFGTIFVNDKYEGSPMLGQILAHEESHIARRHSLDLVWMRLFGSLLWFNPLVWHCTKLLREVHEYQADRDVIRRGNPVMPYIDLLLDTEAGIYPGAANAFCYSLTKKRLLMIAKATRKTTLGGSLRLVALIPVTGLLLSAFSLTARAAGPAPDEVLSRPASESFAVYADGKRVDSTASGPVIIRGPQVKDSTKQPIYVVDGVVYTASEFKKKNVDTKDYTSVTVLKGEAATVKYDEKGRNGAIVITTDKPEKYKKTTYRVTVGDKPTRVSVQTTRDTSGIRILSYKDLQPHVQVPKNKRKSYGVVIVPLSDLAKSGKNRSGKAIVYDLQ